MKGIIPVSARVENARQNLKSGGDMTERSGDVKAEKTEKMSEDIEKDYRMGYNGDIENQKRNPKDYIEDVEKLNIEARKKAKKKYSQDDIVIHTGTESPENSIDPDDGKVHVWLNSGNMKPIENAYGMAENLADPNIKVFGSHKIKGSFEQEAVMNIIMNSKEFKQTDEAYQRNIESYIKEWETHNVAYEFFKLLKFAEDVPIIGSGIKAFEERTKDVDLNTIDIGGILYDWEMYGKLLEAKND